MFSSNSCQYQNTFFGHAFIPDCSMAPNQRENHILFSSSSRLNRFLGLLCTQHLRQCELMGGRFMSATVPAGGSDRALCLGSLPPVGGGGAVRFSANKPLLAELCMRTCVVRGSGDINMMIQSAQQEYCEVKGAL